LDAFNEVCVLLLSYHLIAFNDVSGSHVVRYNIGWSMAGITVLNITVNMLVVISFALVNLYRTFREYRQSKSKGATKVKKGVIQLTDATENQSPCKMKELPGMNEVGQVTPLN